MDLTFLSQTGLPVTPKALLSNHTTFKLGGPCLALIECRSLAELTKAITTLRAHNAPFILMGFGSNILVSDHGIDRIIVRYTTDMPIIDTSAAGILDVDAATQFDDFTRFVVESGIEGMASFSGIPGTVGGAIAGNAGAYGEQISDNLISVKLLRPDNSVVKVPRNQIKFTYRDSDLKHSEDIILSGTFRLLPAADPAALQMRRNEILAERESKFGNWKNDPCAGSFFRNIEPTSKASKRTAAGAFLEKAGAKQMNIRGAHTYPNHANIVTREDGTKAQAVYELTLQMASAVKTKFGINLIREVRLLGKFDQAENCNPEGYW